jgi:hypothetical protein
VGLWTANEGVAHLKEAQRPADLAGNAYAHTCANVRSLPNRSAKPKQSIGTQINAIQTPVDLQCSRKQPGSSRQINQFVSFAAPLH